MKQILLRCSDFLVHGTERYLTYRARRKARITHKQKKRGMLLDWAFSFFWAVGVVLLLNQYLFQGYLIPSDSMIPTLIRRDRIFVNKLIYGPELLPGFLKFGSLTRPARFDVVIFENPDYLSKGTLFEVLQRVLYMISLSTIDINRDSFGMPKVQFLIKRLIGLPGDTMKLVRGQMYYKLSGTNTWLHEDEFRQRTDAMFPDNDPQENLAAIEYRARQYVAQRYFFGTAATSGYSNHFDFQRFMAMSEYELRPYPLHSETRYSVYKNGWYVADNHFFFMGDNRDNSKDSRYYSGVPVRNVLGKAFIIYFPFRRFSLIR